MLRWCKIRILWIYCTLDAGQKYSAPMGVLRTRVEWDSWFSLFPQQTQSQMSSHSDPAARLTNDPKWKSLLSPFLNSSRNSLYTLGFVLQARADVFSCKLYGLNVDVSVVGSLSIVNLLLQISIHTLYASLLLSFHEWTIFLKHTSVKHERKILVYTAKI